VTERATQVRGTAVREKILSTADRLFYREGVRAVGVDRIIAVSGVAKTSLYRWFPTKDDLIAAYLSHRDGLFWSQWNKVSKKFRDDPHAELEGHLRWIAKYVGGSEFRGCPFINTATEFPDPDHPGRAVCEANKRLLRARILELCKRNGATDPELLADQLTLLIEGAFATAQVTGKSGPARGLEAAGKALIAIS